MSSNGSSSRFPFPRFGVPASDRPSFGEALTETAAALNVELLPWQKYVARVGLEHENGRPVYRDVGLSTPRQSGKSLLLAVLMLSRMLSSPGQRVAYGAQSRLAARGRLFDRWWPLIRRSKLRDLFEITRATGFESLRCANGSILQLLSSEESSAHGETLDLVVVDECWALGPEAETAVRPTLVTRRAGQLWLASAAGNERSTWWRSKVDAGRAACESGLSDGGAFFEWSAADDDDPGDPEVWARCMPALGSLIDVETIRSDLAAMMPAEFRRCHLNQWSDVFDEGWQVVAKDVWMAARL